MATRTQAAAVAVFDNVGDARDAVRELRDVGFTEEEIGVLSHDRETGEVEARSPERTAEKTKAPEGAATGAAVGGGAAALWSVGIAAGMLPAIGPVIAGGALAAALASAAGGAVVGGAAGALIGLGIPEDEAEWYGQEFEGGRTIVTVRSPDRHDEALSILTRHGGHTRR